MKLCFKCQTEKPKTEFYRHPKMADGLLGKCKDCAKNDVNKNRNAKQDYYREYDKMRFQRDGWRRENNRAHSKTEDGRKSAELSRLKWKTANPEKRAAHIILGNAVRGGRVKKPDECSRCGRGTESKFLHGHHHDYALPLVVEWICVWCHAAEHFPNEYRKIIAP